MNANLELSPVRRAWIKPWQARCDSASACSPRLEEELFHKTNRLAEAEELEGWSFAIASRHS
jgi:hypothetical protein